MKKIITILLVVFITLCLIGTGWAGRGDGELILPERTVIPPGIPQKNRLRNINNAVYVIDENPYKSSFI